MHDFIEGCCKAGPRGKKRTGISSGNCQKRREKGTKERSEKVNMKEQEMRVGWKEKRIGTLT